MTVRDFFIFSFIGFGLKYYAAGYKLSSSFCFAKGNESVNVCMGVFPKAISSAVRPLVVIIVQPLIKIRL